MIRHSLLPLPVPMCLLRLYLPHLTSSKASQIYCLTTSIPVPLNQCDHRKPLHSFHLPRCSDCWRIYRLWYNNTPPPYFRKFDIRPLLPCPPTQPRPPGAFRSTKPSLFSASHPILDNTDSTGCRCLITRPRQ
ncbi:hypothetical protein EDB92DRAFT_1494832 [Lactarius akahatsu]|uniref:Uncharacterized protein n=1 Tax=Lactarius akahatsu TaxID=416441 RepID=A0AAD4LAS0_9AGAM|nr:hypothetical protein EDB92DRAFT_1494832 [Lactarius akahatsu]